MNLYKKWKKVGFPNWMESIIILIVIKCNILRQAAVWGFYGRLSTYWST
jgi:hypothetical protein